MVLNGIGASKGVAIGKVFIKKEFVREVSLEKITDIDKEIKVFEDAKKVAIEELQVLYDKAVATVGEKHAKIFEVHQMLTDDLDLYDEVVKEITLNKCNAAYAVQEAGKTMANIFNMMNDEYMKERATDVYDITNRIIEVITGVRPISLADLTEPVVVISHDLYPSDTIQMNKEFVLGFVTEVGGKVSHSAILARTMQIPAILGIEKVATTLCDQDTIILDGESGQLIVNPDPETLNLWKEKQSQYKAYLKELKDLAGTPNRTKDGVHIELNANIGSVNDIAAVLENDTKGIGLFRSEFLYMDSPEMPTEQTQFEAYKEVLEAMEDRVIVRTLDIGGDKSLPYLDIPAEDNPFLGYRAIRICLDKQDIFKIQLRALLRASVYGKLGIMFPMIATVNELKKAKEILEQCKKDLVSEGVKVSNDIEIGMMIETPAAVMVTDLLAKDVDFFSIGTNDLTQYTIAVDRMNSKIADLYDSRNLSVLRMIKTTVDNAHANNVWVGICGESAADTELTELYLAIGIDELSVTPSSIFEVRKKIQELTVSSAKKSALYKQLKVKKKIKLSNFLKKS
ncbi:phosphoenolpyruvate--protein phosphotransferase [Candidatus Epulonipiscium fishelsonii]|uniref:Phosphoenolpyruvate--protein phosphotransferase n=1 Tax=Candidatus Epulonipiscium fishelsonii TaxID=77094 RepID=A0ACC8XCI9_9FIRM|nr:phosphoenolpyruvate--protein phosphotransferase [Epulopiscium sp. SCG-B05WGA-EpuloA1]ONI40413.1 phosphoenolpyruvate--protein phosphotransferase [Epulopiscium sp. SCG-B11WGA-EpuloA1]